MAFLATQKPPKWGFQAGLVAPEWEWFHDDSFLSGGPLWEGAGNPYDYGDRSFTTLISDAEWKGDIPGPSIELNDDSHTGGDTIELTNFDATKLDGLTTFTYAVHFTFIGTAAAAEDTLGLMWSSLQGTTDNNAKRILVRYDSQNNQLDFFTFTTSDNGLTTSANLEDGKPHTVVFRYDSPNTEKSIWLDGINIGSNSNSGALQSAGHSKVSEVFGGHLVTIGVNTDSPRIRGYGWALHNKVWTDQQIRQWSCDPFGPFRMADEVGLFVPAAVAATTMVAAQGSYTLTGKAANTLWGHAFAASQGSYTLTGKAAITVKDTPITAAQGSYALTGQASNLLWGHLVDAVQGSYALTGQAAVLSRQVTIVADQGSYALNGQAADLKRHLVLAAQGSYALTGQAAVISRQVTIVGAQGSYTLTGQAADLLWGHLVAAAQGSYALTGQAAVTTKDTPVVAAQGAYSLTGQAANLLWGHALPAVQGSYALTGKDALTFEGARLIAVQGSYALNGQAVVFVVVGGGRKMLPLLGVG